MIRVASIRLARELTGTEAIRREPRLPECSKNAPGRRYSRRVTRDANVLREGGRVTGVRRSSDGGPEVHEFARIVIGAHDVRPTLATDVDALSYHDKAELICAYYSCWSGVETPQLTLYPRPGCAIAAIPTHDGLPCAYGCLPANEFHAVRSGIAGRLTRAIAQHAADLAARLRAATREERFAGSSRMPNFFRQSHGPGWALIGDASFHKDPVGARGIPDAFRDAARVAEAAHAGLSAQADIDAALTQGQPDREAISLARYERYTQFAALESPDHISRRVAAARRVRLPPHPAGMAPAGGPGQASRPARRPAGRGGDELPARALATGYQQLNRGERRRRGAAPHARVASVKPAWTEASGPGQPHVGAARSEGPRPLIAPDRSRRRVRRA